MRITQVIKKLIEEEFFEKAKETKEVKIEMIRRGMRPNWKTVNDALYHLMKKDVLEPVEDGRPRRWRTGRRSQ